MHWLFRILPTLLVSTTCLVAQAASVRVVGAKVIVNEQPTIEFRASTGNKTAVQRATACATAIRGAAEPAKVDVTAVGQERLIRINGQPLVAVGRADALANKSAPSEIARTWASRLSDALDLPPLQLSSERLVMPVGGVATVSLLGSQVRFASIQTDSPGVARVTRNESSVTVKALAVGTSISLIRAGDAQEGLRVEVLPLAASFPQRITAEVAGGPALASTVKGAVESAIRSQLTTMPGSSVSVALPAIPSVRSQTSKTITARIAVRAPGCYPSSGYVAVSVRNDSVGRVADSDLWYCNDPESVRGPGNLYAVRLKQDHPARMLYHHMNAASQPMYFRVEVVNDSDTPAKLMVMPGDATPDRNPIIAGADAAEQYMRGWIFGSGEVITIPPQSAVPVSLRNVHPLETMSGLCSLSLLSGPVDVLVRTDAYAPFYVSEREKDAFRTPTPWRITGAKQIDDYDLARHELTQHVYPNPQKAPQTYVYRVGGRHQYIRIGERAIERQDGANTLDGNFGVLYRINVVAVNPTSQTTNVDVRLVPSAGFVVGLFVVNGELVRTPIVTPGRTHRLVRLRLRPGEQKELRLWTVPVSGCSYPATIRVGATD